VIDDVHPHIGRADRLLAERLVRSQPVERSLELAHIREFDPRELLDDAGAEVQPPLFALASENRNARLVVRRADVHDQPAREPRQQPLIDIGDLRWRPIARHHDLPAAALERGEQPEHLALRLPLTGQELDIIEDQEVDGVESLLECIRLRRRDRRVELLHELVEREVDDLELGLKLEREMPQRPDEMGLPQPRAAVDEQRVVRRAR
jgi:hypothetical protein